jgi:prevent-host-death family protein
MATRRGTKRQRVAAGGGREIPAGEFKAGCLALMDRVRERGEEYVITKHGKPVAKLVPVKAIEAATSAWGCMKGTVLWYGDLISPIDVEWDALKDENEAPDGE